MFAQWPLLGLIAVPLTVLLTGAALAWAGWRGRRTGDHPTCRRCGFDLFGRPEGAGVCSECGADLYKPRATVTGSRVRRPALLLAGAALALGGGARLAADLRREVAQDPNAYKPTWWLVREARGANAALRDDALVELGSRLEHGRLPQGPVDALVDRALEIQGDAGAPWPTVWGDWVERVLVAGRLSDARRDRYFRQGMGPWYASLVVRPRVRRGDRFPLIVQGQPGPRLGGRPSYVVRDHAVLFDGVPLVLTAPRDDWFFINPNLPTVLRADQVPFGRLGDGRHTVVVAGTFVCSAPGRPADSAGTAVPFRVEQTWELIPADAPAAEVVDDPSLLETIRPLVAGGVELRDGPVPGTFAEVTVILNRLPVGVAYDVILRSGESEWPAGTVCAPHGVYAQRGSRASLRGAPGGHMDIVLRPNPSAAIESVDVLRVWNQELVLPNVLVTRRPPRRSPGPP